MVTNFINSQKDSIEESKRVGYPVFGLLSTVRIVSEFPKDFNLTKEDSDNIWHLCLERAKLDFHIWAGVSGAIRSDLHFCMSELSVLESNTLDKDTIFQNYQKRLKEVENVFN